MEWNIIWWHDRAENVPHRGDTVQPREIKASRNRYSAAGKVLSGLCEPSHRYAACLLPDSCYCVCSDALHHTILYNTMLHTTVLHMTMLHISMLHTTCWPCHAIVPAFIKVCFFESTDKLCKYHHICMSTTPYSCSSLCLRVRVIVLSDNNQLCHLFD